MQKVFNVTCSFVVQQYAIELDGLRTEWLPVEECIKYSICQMVHKSIADKLFPSYLRLEIKKHSRHRKYGFVNRRTRYEQNNL